MRLTFVETLLFSSGARDLIADAELIALQDALLRDPLTGDLVAGTGGIRKTRVATRGKGKRGGARVIYYCSRRSATIFLLLAYAKAQAEVLSPAGRKYLKTIAENLDRET